MTARQWESSGSGESDANCTGFYTSYEKKIILLSVGCTGLLSIFLCGIAIALVIYFKLHKQFAYRLASYQVMASMLISFTVLLATVPIIGRYTTFCEITGFFMEYFLWVKLIFVLCLIFHIFCFAVFFKNFKKLELGYIILAFCFPLLFTWIPLIHRSYGLTESWCWIRDADCKADRYKEGFIEQRALWFGPLAVSIIISFIAIAVILVALKCRYNQVVSSNSSTSEASEKDALIKAAMKTYMLKVCFRKLIPLLIYPLAFFILFLFPVVQPRLLNHSLSSHVNFRLSVAHSVCYTSFGLLSSLLLILHVFLVRHLKTWNEHFFPDHEDYKGFEPSLHIRL